MFISMLLNYSYYMGARRYVIKLFVLYGRSPPMMNAVSDTICDGGRAIC